MRLAVLAASLPVLIAFSGPAAALTVTGGDTNVTPLGWSVVGLDSNDVTVGPDQFPVGARFCASSPVSGVTASWGWTGAGSTTDDSLIHLADTSTRYAAIAVGALSAGSCYDAYWNVQITRSASAYQQSRAYQVTFTDGSGSTLGTTNADRRIYVEHLISQNRNTVGSVSLDSGGNTVIAGHTYAFTVTGLTASTNDQLDFAAIFPSATFRLLKSSFTYSTFTAPATGTADQVYADACGWQYLYDVSGVPGQCTTAAGAGGAITAHYTVLVLPTAATGPVSVNTLIYDHSGSSFHYNSDFGAGSAFNVLVQGSVTPTPTPTPTAPSTATLTTTITGSGTIIGNTGSTTYPLGSDIILWAVPDSGWEFAGWTGACSGGAVALALVIDAGKTCGVTFEKAAVVQAPVSSPSRATRVKMPTTVRTGL